MKKMKLIINVFFYIYIYFEIFFKNINTLPLSIVVPVFNTSPYLNRSINSILDQTFKDFELILVDDASTDNSLEILVNYSKIDNRIKTIHFEINKGVSAARNAGIDIAKGEFIGFVDSDDFIDKRFYENLLKNSKDYDVIEGNFIAGTNISESYKKLNLRFHCSIFDSIWRRDFLNKYNLRYDESMRNGSDKKFRMEVYQYKPRIFVSPDEGIYYYYKRRVGSLSNFSEIQLKYLNKEAFKEIRKQKRNKNKHKKLIKREKLKKKKNLKNEENNN